MKYVVIAKRDALPRYQISAWISAYDGCRLEAVHWRENGESIKSAIALNAHEFVTLCARMDEEAKTAAEQDRVVGPGGSNAGEETPCLNIV